MRALFLLSALIFGCAYHPPPNPNLPPPPAETEQEVHDTEYCAAAEFNLNKPYFQENCPTLGARTKKGKSFTDFCIETQNNGIYLHPRCLAEARTCEAARACMNEGR